MKPVWKRTIARVLVYSLLLGTLGVMFRWFEQHQVYFPSRRMDWTPVASDWAFENVFLSCSDGVRVNGWFIPISTNAPLNRPAVLILHGNGGNISHRDDLYELVRRLELNVFALDYRGYGQSEGKPGEQGTYLDAEAAFDWLVRKGFAATNILIFGESLGGGVASELALCRPAGGLILQSTFTSIPDIGAELFPWLPVRWLASIKYDTHAKLPRVRVPVLIMHSRQDRLIGFHHAERNFAVANAPKLFREIRGDHNDRFETAEGRERFLDGMREFLRPR